MSIFSSSKSCKLSDKQIYFVQYILWANLYKITNSKNPITHEDRAYNFETLNNHQHLFSSHLPRLGIFDIRIKIS